MLTDVGELYRTLPALSVEEVQAFVKRLWCQGEHFSTLSTEVIPKLTDYEHIPWEKVDCMLTKMVSQQANGLTFAFDMFPPQSAAKAELHIHPLSDRIIVVVEGTGHAFVKTAGGSVATKEVQTGDVILFPRGIAHAFWGSENEPMSVNVILSPYVELEHPLHTVCPVKARKLSQDPKLKALCDAGELEALATLVQQLMDKGEISLGDRETMDWGDDIIRGTRPGVSPQDNDWECKV